LYRLALSPNVSCRAMTPTFALFVLGPLAIAAIAVVHLV
jgi:hypothetical protein